MTIGFTGIYFYSPDYLVLSAKVFPTMQTRLFYCQQCALLIDKDLLSLCFVEEKPLKKPMNVTLSFNK